MNQNQYKKIISSAIEREIEAYTFYRMVSDKAKDKNIKSLFGKLAEERAGASAYIREFSY